MLTAHNVPSGGDVGLVLPAYCRIVHVNVCVAPTALVPFGVILISASTQHLSASTPTAFAVGDGLQLLTTGVFDPVAVARVSDTPSTLNVVDARTSSIP